ncbi:S-layer protein [Pelosinus sp. IPA-1]|uniref:S-layer protein n=1 Tax=Pelosinus sp. IPA-1 TaxID=3029569 RepID=UPI00255775AB|nr:S-layer protein [Pelosinus sp. IPA-1]
MKKVFILLFSVATIVGIPINEHGGNVVYASNEVKIEGGNKLSVIPGNTEKFKAEFAYEMAQITGKILSTPTTNVENFKVEFAYSIARVTAKIMPILPNDQKNEFAYKMAQITTKIISDPNLDVEKAKADFAYEIAQITTRFITNPDKLTTDKNTMLTITNDYVDPKTMLRNNADIEPKTVVQMNNTEIKEKAKSNTNYISPETYTGLIDDLSHVGDRSSQLDNKVKIDGEIRYHYALNSGPGQLDRDSSGIRARIGFNSAVNQDWRAYGMLEGQKNVVNYNNDFKLSHLYVAGKSGESMVTAGSFGYLMADGNIYDSDFKGVKVEFGDPIKYTVSYGETDYTKRTFIATARYNDIDYNLEVGAHHYQKDDGDHSQNTIWTLGGNYNFSNFGLGAMALGSTLTDSKGYVLSATYGELKTWRPGTYGVFAKYYNQPQGTYIAHGMNGIGNSMQGFKGYGLGINYTLTENVVTGIEYYGLKDKISGEQGDTWWSHLTHYF